MILDRRATAQRLTQAAAEDAQHTDAQHAAGQHLAEAADTAQRAHRDIYAMHLDITSGRTQAPAPATVVPVHPSPCPGLEHTTPSLLPGSAPTA